MKGSGSAHAIVLGGSIAGLLAARVLADAYDEVTVLDRDDLDSADARRRGTPQSRHIHALLARGEQVLGDLFPGFTDELVRAGAPTGDTLGAARLLIGGHRLAKGETGLVAVSVTRPLLEKHLRARVQALPAVRIDAPGDAVGLRLSSDGRRVTGVRVQRRGDGGAEEVLDADVVVDATGRGSRMPRWLDELGFEAPRQDEVGIDVGYSTRRYALAPDALGGDLACIHSPVDGDPRGGALARMEGSGWILTLFGFLGDHPPRDAAGFDAFARSLRFGDIAEAVGDAEALDDEPATYRFAADVRRRYERLRRVPEGIVVIGDALACLNPAYGQGMSSAALQALALRDRLPADGASARETFRALARAIDVPWQLATGADLAYREATGRRTPATRFANRYIGRLQAAAAHDEVLARSFWRVTGLVDPPQTLMGPRMMRRVAFARTGSSAPSAA